MSNTNRDGQAAPAIKPVAPVATSTLPTKYGDFRIHVYKSPD